MTAKSIDFALRVAADLGDAKRQVDALGGSVDKLNSAGKNAAQGLDAATNATGKSTKATKADTAATDAAAAAKKKLGTETEKTTNTQKRLALTAGELRNAQRQLPAQITDIVTSLASGQSVFMVAIQQGGQLKDSWGGIVPAGRALLGALNPMVIGLSAGAAAFGAIALAGIEFARERQEITQALLQTGNYAGTSVVEVEALADSIAELDGVTAGGARDALLQVAQSGKFAGEQFEMVAIIAARMEAATGQAIDTTIQKFAEIAKDPVQALLKLNETEHFLTAEHLARLQALISLGLEQDAAAEGARIYADRLDQIATAADAAQPHLSRLWREMKEGASAAWEETKEFAEFLAAAGEQYSKMPWWQRIGPAAGINSIRAMYGAQPVAPPAVASVTGVVDSKAETKKAADRKKTDDERKRSEQEWDALLQSNLSKQQRLESEIVKIRSNGLALGKSDAEIAGQIANARARYAESLPKGKKAGGGKSEAQQDQEAIEREIESLNKQIALTATLAEGERQISHEARVAYEIKAGAYRLSSQAAQQEALAAAKRRDAQLAEIENEQKKKKAYDAAEREYERLREALETPVEATISDVKAQVEALNNAMAAGVPIAGGYDAALKRIFEKSNTKAPELPGQFAQAGGPLGDGIELAEYGEALDKWRADEILKNDAYLASKEMSEEAHQARMDEIRAEYGARQSAFTQSQSQFMLGAASSLFGSLAEIARNGAGEQSKTYRALFAISKGFAIAQALIAVYQNAANAMKDTPYPYNIPIVIGAVAQGMAILSQLKSVEPQGYAIGGRIVGPGTRTSDSVPIWASVDEHMIKASSATQPGAREFLNDFNDRGMPALYDWTRAARHAAGGAITAAPEARGQISAAGASPVNLSNDMALFLYQDRDALAAAVANNPAVRKAIVAEVTENGQAIRMAWGLG